MIASRAADYIAGDFTVHFPIKIQQLSLVNPTGITQLKIVVLKYWFNHGIHWGLDFCWSLHQLGLNSPLDFHFKGRCKTYGCVRQQGQGQKQQQQKQREAVWGRSGNRKGGERERGKGGSEGYQQLWQLCGYGELSHNREVPGQECRTDRPDSGLRLGPTWQAGPGHNIQQLPNPKLLPWYPSPRWKSTAWLLKNIHFSSALYLHTLFPVCVCHLLGLGMTRHLSAPGTGHIMASQSWADWQCNAVRHPSTESQFYCQHNKGY